MGGGKSASAHEVVPLPPPHHPPLSPSLPLPFTLQHPEKKAHKAWKKFASKQHRRRKEGGSRRTGRMGGGGGKSINNETKKNIANEYAKQPEALRECGRFVFCYCLLRLHVTTAEHQRNPPPPLRIVALTNTHIVPFFSVCVLLLATHSSDTHSPTHPPVPSPYFRSPHLRPAKYPTSTTISSTPTHPHPHPHPPHALREWCVVAEQ